MASRETKPVTGQLVEEELELTLSELCQITRLPAERLLEFIDHGVIEPQGPSPARWRFHGVCVRRVRRARRLQRDLDINTAGAALVLDLLEELDALRARVHRLENQHS